MGILEKFEFSPELVPKIKLGVHAAQGVLAFIVFVLQIVVFRAQESRITGNNGWTFGMCFLTIPAILYLAMAPRWERTRRIAQPHAMLVVDAIWTILWLTAFATQVAYNSAGDCGQGCNVSKGVAAVAFFEIVLWGASTAVSFITLKHYQSNGVLPGYESLDSGRRVGGENIDPDKAAFSMAPHDEESYAPVHMDDRHDDDHHHDNPYSSDTYGASNSGAMYEHDTAYRPHSTSPPLQDNPFDNTYQMNDPYSDSYGNSYGGAQASHPQVYAPPTADDYDPSRPAQFPSGNYDRTMH